MSYAIGDLAVDLVRRDIRRHGKALPCGKLTFDLLALLAERAPRVVSREELAERLWAGRYVSSATVKQRVALLRRALGDHAERPKYVRAVRGQGYALIPAVKALDGEAVSPGWKRVGRVAGVAVMAFLIGLEVGYKEGLTPRIPDLDKSASILVTTWPTSSDNAEVDDELPQEDYGFVIGVAEQVLAILENADFVSKLRTAHALGGTIRPKGSLAVVANASIRDRETISVSLAVLDKSLSDDRLARIYAMELLSRAVRQLPEQDRELSRLPRLLDRRLAPLLDADIKSALISDSDIRIIMPDQHEDREFMLMANFNFNRGEIQQRPGAIQADAARLVAMAIDDQVPGVEFLGTR